MVFTSIYVYIYTHHQYNELGFIVPCQLHIVDHQYHFEMLKYSLLFLVNSNIVLLKKSMNTSYI